MPAYPRQAVGDASKQLPAGVVVPDPYSDALDPAGNQLLPWRHGQEELPQSSLNTAGREFAKELLDVFTDFEGPSVPVFAGGCTLPRHRSRRATHTSCDLRRHTLEGRGPQDGKQLGKG
ncbi:hypothetical protein [Streptodolium elevatio]|uniref:Uncharacterized protein n=1 Tax=Streptodolium elevatio TaxID=3157996 RepID=A0ABV3DWH1_9ACTN